MGCMDIIDLAGRTDCVLVAGHPYPRSVQSTLRRTDRRPGAHRVQREVLTRDASL